MSDASYQPAVYRRQGGDAYVVTTDGSIVKENFPQAITWSVAAESSDTRAITATLTDADGTTVSGCHPVWIVLLADSSGSAYTTASTALAALTSGSAGTIAQIVIQKLYLGICSTAGVLGMTWTDTSAETAYIGAILEDGTYSISTAAITCAS